MWYEAGGVPLTCILIVKVFLQNFQKSINSVRKEYKIVKRGRSGLWGRRQKEKNIPITLINIKAVEKIIKQGRWEENMKIQTIKSSLKKIIIKKKVKILELLVIIYYTPLHLTSILEKCRSRRTWRSPSQSPRYSRSRQQIPG